METRARRGPSELTQYSIERAEFRGRADELAWLREVPLKAIAEDLGIASLFCGGGCVGPASTHEGATG